MQASLEFLTFACWYIQDIDRIAPTIEEMYDFGLRGFQGEERIRLREFLDRAVREASDATLERLWKEVGAGADRATTPRRRDGPTRLASDAMSERRRTRTDAGLECPTTPPPRRRTFAPVRPAPTTERQLPR